MNTGLPASFFPGTSNLYTDLMWSLSFLRDLFLWDLASHNFAPCALLCVTPESGRGLSTFPLSGLAYPVSFDVKPRLNPCRVNPTANIAKAIANSIVFGAVTALWIKILRAQGLTLSTMIGISDTHCPLWPSEHRASRDILPQLKSHGENFLLCDMEGGEKWFLSRGPSRPYSP